MPCSCRCESTCGRQCKLDLMECLKKHYKKDCDHIWDGPWEEGEMGEDGYWSSTTCSKCGMVQMHHDMAVGP